MKPPNERCSTLQSHQDCKLCARLQCCWVAVHTELPFLAHIRGWERKSARTHFFPPIASSRLMDRHKKKRKVKTESRRGTTWRRTSCDSVGTHFCSMWRRISHPKATVQNRLPSPPRQREADPCTKSLRPLHPPKLHRTPPCYQRFCLTELPLRAVSLLPHPCPRGKWRGGGACQPSSFGGFGQRICANLKWRRICGGTEGEKLRQTQKYESRRANEPGFNALGRGVNMHKCCVHTYAGQHWPS